MFPKGIDYKPLSYYYEAHHGTQYTADNPATIATYNSWEATTKTNDLGPLWKLTGSPENTIKGLKNTGRGAGIHVNYNNDTGNVKDQFWMEIQTKTKTINNHDYLVEHELWRQEDLIGYWGKANTVLLNQNPEKYIQSFHEYINEAVNYWGYDNTIKSLFNANDTVVCWTDKIDDMIKYQNAIWQYREKLFAPFIQKFSNDVQCQRWQGYNEVPVSHEFAIPRNQGGKEDSGFAFSLPVGATDIMEYINRKPVGTIGTYEPSPDEKRGFISEQFDLYYFGYIKGQTSPQKGAYPYWIGPKSWIYNLATLWTGKENFYYRTFSPMDTKGEAFPSQVNPRLSYQVSNGVLTINGI